MSRQKRQQPKGRSGKTHSTSRRNFIKKSAAAVGLAVSAPVLNAFAQVGVVDSDEVYDYVIVGSGPGGGPLAVNLAKAGHRVLLMEAGGSEANQNTKVPAFHGLSTEDKKISWSFYVKHYTDLVQQMRNSKFDKRGGGILYPRAAAVGGCSEHNAMITMYPENSDWSRMAELTGSSAFAPEAMRDMFQRLERNRYRLPAWDIGAVTSRNGYGGWLSTEMTPLKFLLKDPRFLQVAKAAVEEEGLWNEFKAKIASPLGALDLDPNSWHHVVNSSEGIFNVPKATHNGVRSGLRDLILSTLKSHPKNLFLKTHALATRVIFEGQENRAVGVAYVNGKNLYKADPSARRDATFTPSMEKQVRARKEVILAGGAFNSPQLLMLSGIGDRAHLASKGIASRVHLPGVGKNLQDRYEVGVVSRTTSEFEALADCTYGKEGDKCLEEWSSGSQSSLYTTNGVLIGVKKRSVPERPDPDLFVFGIPGDFRGYFNGWSTKALDRSAFTWAVLKGHTQNTSGNILLNSKNPFDTPEINFRYFDDGKAWDGEDMTSVLKGLKLAQRINDRMKDANGKGLIKEELVPGPKGLPNDDALKQFIKDEAWGHHASCTNKMGPVGLGVDNELEAVVDAEFRVYGTKGLRVVDASIFPRIPGLFIAVPIYMISEKASDIILKGKG